MGITIIKVKNILKNFNKEVKRLTLKIQKEYKPDKIIIFGSFASGKITQDSDVDFFIIKKTAKLRRERNREVSRLLIDRQIPVDILVYTPSEVRKRKEMGDYFIKDILHSGKLVYAK